MRKLLKSIMVGTIVGAAAPASLGLVFVLNCVVAFGPLHEQTLATLGFVVLLIGLICAVATLSSLFIGLPTTWMLQRLGAESNMAYSVIGGAAGFLLPFLILQVLMPAALIAGFIGCLSGLATAHTWWRWSRAKANSVDGD